jgi:hypothetical protein
MKPKTHAGDSGRITQARPSVEGEGTMTNSDGPGPSRFPSLPIINPEVTRRSQHEKYGNLFILGIAGLIVVVGLVGWFGFRMWSMRDVWATIYVLHDAQETEENRARAALLLSRDPRVEQHQLWDLALNRRLPDLARYILAEGIGTDLVALDPQGYVSALARSPDWPDWLRLVLTRPLAYAATSGHSLSRERLGELCRLHDPALRLWALYTLAVQTRPDPQTVVEIEHVAQAEGTERRLAELFLAAVRSDQPHRLQLLDQATAWNREHHPEVRRLWQGWTVHEGRLERSPPG